MHYAQEENLNNGEEEEAGPFLFFKSQPPPPGHAHVITLTNMSLQRRPIHALRITG